ncbi:hypothetical protein QM012_009369 [Aureobasidium pullulans]|uniref:NUDE domain-containing protein n=1 Tax=Aureobasidium pullulans TaxID=5580 RepID=A0ABR0TGN7_AURPU
MSNPPSSPFRHGTTVEQELAYYKAQYEQLEVELQEFQQSSRELEAELEKDVEASEKRERKLKERVESLGFEVEEWKTKYKQSKAEANAAQTTLQKEITTMRETNRTLQLKLRDIEVDNDDYERQARNTTSSLEELESKYNVAIERGVLLEEEMRAGEQEREDLRIQTQRLRDELSDLRIEADITREKLRLSESGSRRYRDLTPVRRPSGLNARSPTSSRTAASSPTVSTPPPVRSEISTLSDTPTPPSPPLSDASGNPVSKMLPPPKKNPLVQESTSTPRASLNVNTLKPARHSRGPSYATTTTPSGKRRTTLQSRPSVGSEGVPRSSSLYQIKGLIGRMQKIEERVHSVRSKLPPPSANTPRGAVTPKGSPRIGALAGGSFMSNSVTVRNRNKRTSNSTSSSTRQEDSNLPPPTPRSTSSSLHVKTLSFGGQRPHPLERSSTSITSTSTANRDSSRPSSRANNVGETGSFARPPSRTSNVSYGQVQTSVLPTRPRTSMGGTFASSQRSRVHRQSNSLSEARDTEEVATPTIKRTVTAIGGSGIPTPGLKRQSGNGFGNSVSGRRSSLAPSQQSQHSDKSSRKLSDLGETF